MAGDGEVGRGEARGDGSSETAGEDESDVPVIVEECEGGASGGRLLCSSVEKGGFALSSLFERGEGERATDLFRLTGDVLAGEAARADEGLGWRAAAGAA